MLEQEIDEQIAGAMESLKDSGERLVKLEIEKNANKITSRLRDRADEMPFDIDDRVFDWIESELNELIEEEVK